MQLHCWLALPVILLLSALTCLFIHYSARSGDTVLNPIKRNKKRSLKLEKDWEGGSVNDEMRPNCVEVVPRLIEIKNHVLPSSIESIYQYTITCNRGDLILNLTKMYSHNDKLASEREVKSYENLITTSYIVQHLATDNESFVSSDFSRTEERIIKCVYSGFVVMSERYDKNKLGSPWHQNQRGSAVMNVCQGLFGVIELPDQTFSLEPMKDSPIYNLLDKNLPSNQRTHSGRPHCLCEIAKETDAAEKTEDVLQSREWTSYNGSNDRLSTNVTFFDNDEDVVQNTNKSINKRSTASFSHEYYVEVLVVVDSRMKRYHGENLENYVLTLLSIVSTVYRHPSLEAAINIVLTRLIVLDDERIGPRITDDVQETLKRFCLWQQTLNDYNEDSINHHDVAILLTRLDVCRAPGKCDTLGLAELGTMCDFERSCSVIEDNGLSAAFTIAHELGHIFNIPHDDEKKCSQFMNLDSFNFHIMAPTLEYNTHPWSWSLCSMNLLHDFLASEKSSCLFNIPVQQTYAQFMISNAAPGLNFSVHQQCQYVFGPSSQLCPYMPVCKVLWCTSAHRYHSYAGCRTQHTPWADGTPCAMNKWCYRGECVGLAPDQFTSMDGTWGDWQEWSQCSRTCGGGIQRSGRNCDSPRPENGGKYCIGQRVRSRSCNIKECPPGSKDYREVQCSHFNNNHSITSLPMEVQWIPKLGGVQRKDICKLYCTLPNRPDFYMLKSKVVDGTPCGADIDGICVDGICEDVGCDGLLGSELKRDLCGLCGGGGYNCVKRSESFNESTVYGYNLVVVLPVGASNINIEQKAWNGRPDDDNYLALYSESGKFVLNGHFQVTVFQQKISLNGTFIQYSGSDDTIERINITRPLAESLKLYVLSVGQLKPPQIRWEYYITEAGQQQSFEWRFSNEWTECSSACEGFTWRKSLCFNRTDNVVVDDKQCFAATKPISSTLKSCNSHCRAKWITEIKTACSVNCGLGVQELTLTCVAEHLHHRQQAALNDSHCNDLTKPPSITNCYVDCSGFKWSYGSWTECSASCGKGIQLRRAQCVDTNLLPVENHRCEDIALKALEESCNEFSCPSWLYGSWSECSKTCDHGVQVRSRRCLDDQLNVVDEEFCNHSSAEVIQRHCQLRACSRWMFGEWSRCSETCGISTAFRTATCVDDQDEHMPEFMCVAAQKITSKRCLNNPCPRLWFTDWTDCSKSCGGGSKSRQILCTNGSLQQRMNLTECNYFNDSVETKECDVQPCPGWIAESWNECPTDCSNEVNYQRRDVFCDAPANINSDYGCDAKSKPTQIQLCPKVINCRPELNDSLNMEQSQTTTSMTSSSLSALTVSWVTGPWSQCSLTCGEGYKHRNVTCQQRNMTVADAVCVELLPKPLTHEPCLHYFCSQWHVGEWTSCSATCGQDVVQYRSVTCIGPNAFNSAKYLYCDLSKKPSSERPCRLPGCQVFSDGGTAYLLEDQQPVNGWRIGPWGQCSRTCGGGWRQRLVICEQYLDSDNVSSQCDTNQQPTSVQSCGHQNCPQWIIGDWTECNATCGSGYQERFVECVDPENGRVMNLDECGKSGQTPATEKQCMVENCEYYMGVWTASRWGRCSAACGRGVRTRLVRCLVNGTVRNHSFCSQELKPQGKRYCKGYKCPKWKRGHWSKCSSSCGLGIRTRAVHCILGQKQKIVSNSKCAFMKKPVTKASCTESKCDLNRWVASDWTECSTDFCGSSGYQNRTVHCENIGHEKVWLRLCRTLPKPAETKTCTSTKNCSFAWHAGKWSQCSKTCGMGIETRSSICLSKTDQWNRYDKANNFSDMQKIYEIDIEQQMAVVRDYFCLGLLLPASKRRCINRPCELRKEIRASWIISKWSKCSITCGDGIQYRNMKCVDQHGHKTSKLHCLADGKWKPKRHRLCSNPVSCVAENCSRIRQILNTTTDGLYVIRVQSAKLRVYCYGMSDFRETPIEYLPLNYQEDANFAEIYEKRLLRPFSCPNNGHRNDSCPCTLHKNNRGSGISRFSRVRLDVQRMTIRTDDFKFATSTSVHFVPYASAGDCYSALQCPQGRFNVDLRGTGLQISARTKWIADGYRTTLRISREKNGAVINGLCGGFCGRCYPDPNIGLLVELSSR